MLGILKRLGDIDRLDRSVVRLIPEFEGGAFFSAGLYLLASNALGLLAVWCGLWLGRRLG